MKRRFLLLLVVAYAVSVQGGVNRWTSGGPEGGRVHSVAIDPANAAHVYAGTEAGAYRSVDGGQTWQAFSRGLASVPSGFLPGVTAFAVTPTTIYAGTGRGVFRTTGNVWTATAPLGPFFGGGGVYSLAVDPTNPNTVYVGADGGVYKSTDGGASWVWASVGFSCQAALALAIDPTNPNTLYAATCGGMYKSSDAAATWTVVNNGMTTIFVLAVAVDPRNPAIVYAGTTGGVFRSSNAAATWTALNNGIPNNTEINALVMDPTNSSILYAGTRFGETYKSINGGATWIPIHLFLGGVHALAVSPAIASRIFAGTSTGVFRSDDGGAQWAFASNGITARTVGALAIDNAIPPSLYAVDIDGKVLRSTDRGASWIPRSFGIVDLVRSLAVDPTAPNTIYASTVEGVFKSVDGGGMWSWSAVGLEAGFNTEKLVIARSSPNTLYASDFDTRQQYKTTNGGASWTSLGLQNARILAVDPTNASIVYAAGGTTGRGVLKSADGGLTWTPINVGLSEFAYVLVLTIDPINPSIVYCGTLDEGIFKSVDGGASWTAINEGLPTGFDLRGLLVRAIVVDPTSSAVLYAATDSKGVFRSLNGGATWSTLNDGLPTSLVHDLVIDVTGTSLHAATYTGLFDMEIVWSPRRRTVRH